MNSPIIENWTCQKTAASLKDYLLMKEEKNRICSFPRIEGLDYHKWFQAAMNGFYVKNGDDHMQCFCCGIKIPLDMLHKKDITNLHESFSPRCSFIREKEFA